MSLPRDELSPGRISACFLRLRYGPSGFLRLSPGSGRIGLDAEERRRQVVVDLAFCA